MCVTFSGTVSFFLVPITFVHSETEGQRWVTPSPQRAAYARPPRILPCLSWFYTAASLGPAHVSYVRELNPLLLNVPFPSDVISQKTGLPSAVSLRRVHSVIRIPQTLTTPSKQDRLRRQRRDVRHPQNSPPSRREIFQRARKADKAEYHGSKLENILVGRKTGSLGGKTSTQLL